MKKLLCLSFMLLIFTIAISYQISQALYADASQSIGHSFSSATDPETPPITSPSQAIVINEVFANGVAASEWVELFNKTSSSIDISNWIIRDADTFDTLPSGSTIPANGYAIIVGNTSTLITPVGTNRIQLSTATIGNGLLDAGDRVVLENTSTTVIDSLSYGSNATIFILPTMPTGNSLSRQPNGSDTDSLNDWQLDATPSLGGAN